MKDFTPVAKQTVEEVKKGWTYIQVGSMLECLRNEIQSDLLRSVEVACTERLKEPLTILAKPKSLKDERLVAVGEKRGLETVLDFCKGLQELLGIQRKCLTSGTPKALKKNEQGDCIKE